MGCRTAGRAEVGSVWLPLTSPRCTKFSWTHGVQAALCWVRRRERNWKYIWGRTSSVWDFCKAAKHLRWKPKKKKSRSPWRVENNVEINLSTYSQAAIRTWTSVHRWSTQDRQEEGRGCFQERERCSQYSAYVARNTVLIYLLFALPLGKLSASNGLLTGEEAKFSNW